MGRSSSIHNPPVANALTISGLLTIEKVRGALAGVISGGSAMSLNIAGVWLLGLSTPVSTLLFGYLAGGIVGYVVDIMIAKRDFAMTPGGTPTPLAYDAWVERAGWMIRSFAHRHFFRFIVTIVIETLTGLAMLDAAIRAMDRYDLLREWKLRNILAAIVIGSANFVLFGSVLRYDWAYKEVEQPLLNVVVLMWMTITMLVFAVAAGASQPQPQPHASAPPLAPDSTFDAATDAVGGSAAATAATL